MSIGGDVVQRGRHGSSAVGVERQTVTEGGHGHRWVSGASRSRLRRRAAGALSDSLLKKTIVVITFTRNHSTADIASGNGGTDGR